MQENHVHARIDGLEGGTERAHVFQRRRRRSNTATSRSLRVPASPRDRAERVDEPHARIFRQRPYGGS